MFTITIVGKHLSQFPFTITIVGKHLSRLPFTITFVGKPLSRLSFTITIVGKHQLRFAANTPTNVSDLHYIPIIKRRITAL